MSETVQVENVGDGAVLTLPLTGEQFAVPTMRLARTIAASVEREIREQRRDAEAGVRVVGKQRELV